MSPASQYPIKYISSDPSKVYVSCSLSETEEQVSLQPSYNKDWLRVTKESYERNGNYALHESALLKSGFSKVSSISFDIFSDTLCYKVSYRSDPESVLLKLEFPESNPSKDIRQELI